MEHIVAFISDYLIEFMASLLVVALIFRALSFKSSKLDNIYFTTLIREIEKSLEKHKDSGEGVSNTHTFLSNILSDVSNKLPNRSFRFDKSSQSSNSSADDQGSSISKSKGNAKRVVSLRDYVKGQQSLIHSINSESSAFDSSHPPNYSEITNRILSQDSNWVKLFGFVPIEGMGRLIDILPSLFIVFGVFGTFVGIAQALPEIAKIDFDNLETSGKILTNFVTSITFAMRTSIAGIMFSLVLTILNTLFPVKGQRVQTVRKLSNCFEAIWYTIHGSNSVEYKMKKYLEEIAVSMKEVEKTLKEASGPGKRDKVA